MKPLKIELSNMKSFKNESKYKLYRLSKMAGGSDKYGNCECCNKHTDTSYLFYGFIATNDNPITHRPLLSTQFSAVGHKECLTRLAV